jgi:hypothetical protein
MEKKKFGGIWSSGEDSMGLYMGGRQISKRHKRYIRKEDNKFNKEVMDKLLIQGEVPLNLTFS